MDYKRLGERIREERKRLNLTQAQLAEAIDISDTYMGAIERGGTESHAGYPCETREQTWRNGRLPAIRFCNRH